VAGETFDLTFLLKAHDQASAVLHNFGSKAAAVGEQARIAFLGIGAGAAFAVGESLHLAEGFDREMRKVYALAGLSAEEFESMKAKVLDLSTIVPKSAEDLARGLYFVESAGFAGDSAMKVLTASAKAATAGLTDTRTVADAVTSVLNAYKLGADQAGNVTGKLTAAVTAGKTEYGALAGAIGRILPLAAASGINFDQVAASLATMTRVGLNADEAATALRGSIASLEAPSAKTRKAIEDMGLTTDQVRKSMLADYMGTLQMMMEKTGGNVDQLKELFPNIRALTGVLATAGSQGKAYADILDTITKAGNEANEAAFGKTMEGAGPQIELLKNQLAAMAIELGEQLLPYLVDFAKQAREVVSGVREWVKQNPEVAAFLLKLAGVAAALSAVSFVIGPIVAIVGGLIALLGGPLLLAFIAVGAAIYLLVTHWEEIKESAAALWGIVVALFEKGVAAVGEFFSGLGTTIREVLDTIGSTVGGFFSGIGMRVREFLDFWGGLWATFSEKPFYWIAYFVTGAVKAVTDWIGKTAKTVGDFFSELPGRIGGWLTSAWNAISKFVLDAVASFTKWTTDSSTSTADFFSTLPARLGSWLGDTVSAIGTFVLDAWNAFVDWIAKVKKTIDDFFDKLPDKMLKFGKSIVQGLIDGIGSMFSALGTAIQNVVDQIKKGIADALRIGSPSGVFADYGVNLMQGLAAGIRDGAGLAQSAMAQAAGALQVGDLGGAFGGTQQLAYAGGSSGSGGRGGSQVIHIHVDLDGQQIAEAVFDPIAQMTVEGARLAGRVLGG